MSEQVMGKGYLLEVLDASILAGNQFPSIFWDLNITGKELRVLQYVWSHVTRLHETVRVAPKGRDGSPRYWRDKEKMASDCKMSCPTFRSAVRHLHKLGLTTTMDGIEDLELVLTVDDTTHCIGLNPQYFMDLGIRFQENQEKKLDRTSRKYLFHLIKNICPYLYDKTTVKLICNKVARIFQLEDKVSAMESYFTEENTPRELIGTTQVEDDNGVIQEGEIWAWKWCPSGHREVRLSDGTVIAVKNSVRPVSIKAKRTPIFAPKTDFNTRQKERSQRMLKRMLQERDRLFVLTAKEQKVMDMVHYYEQKCRVAKGTSGWRALGQNFREHRNWKHFIRIYDLCYDNNWDNKIYIDSQFDRVRFWKRNQKHPYPNQCYSQGAIKYFHKYQKDYKERYSVDGTAKVKSSKMMKYQEEVIEAVIKDCDHFVQFFKIAPKQRKYRGLTPEQMKFMFIVDHVASLSQYYWASIPWAISYLNRFSTPWVIELTATVAQIQKSRSMVNVITKVVDEVENQLGIPHTVLPGEE